MHDEIKNNLNDPKMLEKLYRENKSQFKKAFKIVFPDIQHSPIAQIWHERLFYETQEISTGTRKEMLVVALLAIIAGIIAKIPDFTHINADFFYPRNIAFIVFPMLSVYFAWKQKLGYRKILFLAVVILLSVVYINILPERELSDTLILAYIHMPLFMWAVAGFAFAGQQPRSFSIRLEYLRFNGELVVLGALILIAGGILSAVTIGLFELINIRIEDFYMSNIAIWGLAAAPVLGTHLVRQNPQLVGYVSPLVAKIFSPLVLFMVVIYLIAIVYTGKNPYTDRDFLILFNFLLIGVMAIILFSVSGSTKTSTAKWHTMMLFALSIVTILVNGIALSAIVFRITEWGFTPNRLAVLGANLLMITNLVVVAFQLFKTLKFKNELEGVENSIAFFLPVYAVWAFLVTFIFPLLFNFQ